MEKEKIKEFLEAFSHELEKDQIKFFEKIIDNSKIKEFNGPEEFYHVMIYPWDKFVSGFLKSCVHPSNEVGFIYHQWNYLYNHFTELFRQFEGMVCCADKARTVLNKTLLFFTVGEKIKFDYEGEYTFHLPKRIFKEHEQIINYYEGLRDMFFGRPLKYLENLEQLAQYVKEKEP